MKDRGKKEQHKRERDREGGKQRRLKRKAGWHGMTVTAQLMLGHEMGQSLIMIEHVFERQTEGKGRQKQ